MPRFAIHSLDDPRLDLFRHLKSTNLTRWSGLFIAEGRRVVERLLASEFEVESLLVSEEREPQIAPLVTAETPLYVIPIELARELVGYNFHTGVLACGRRRPTRNLSDLVNDRNKPLALVVCPDVTDPENLGSIVRTSSAFGVDGLLLGSGCADPFSRRVSRLSMGHVYRLPIVESCDLHEDLLRLRNEYHVELAATVLESDAERLTEVPRPRRFALLLGNEAHGLAPEWVQLCQRKITIPMRAAGDSLNVSVSAAIFLYHFMRSAIENNEAFEV